MPFFGQQALRAEIIRAATFVRETVAFDEADKLGRFTLTIEIKGSCDKADAGLQFSFDFSRYYGTQVKSPRLDAALSEILRRMDFDAVNQAELLSYDADKEQELAELQAPTPALPSTSAGDG